MRNHLSSWVGSLALLVISFVALFGGASANAELIDNFSNAVVVGGLAPPGVNLIGAPASQNTSDTVAGVIGGTRLGTFNLTGVAGNGNLTAFVTAGVLSMNLGANSTGNHQLTYNANGAGLNVNFSADLGLELFVDLDLAAAVGTTFQVTLTDTNSSHTASVLVTSAAPQVISFLFPSFTSPGTLDLTNIQSIVLLISPAAEGDVVIDNFQQILAPEPSSVLVWGSVLAAGWFARRRFRKAKA